MISGARIGQPTWLRHLVARAESHALTAFVVPGTAVARAHRLDLVAAGLSIAPTPRHANLLVVIGELPEGLVQPMAVAYAQMARPRAILSIGTAHLASLPAPDVTVTLDQAALTAGIAALQRRFAAGAWAADADAFAIEGDTQHGAMDHAGHNHHMMHGGMEMTEHEATPSEPQDMPMDHGGHDGMAMDMDMDMDMSGGFMSMVAMTQDLPRSQDGLPMEWSEAPFGPLFPGLPGGLMLTLILDGDTVVQATVTPGAVHRGLAGTWPGPAASFPDRLASLDPLISVAYRVLASRALEHAAAVEPTEAIARHRVGAQERERAVSHLSWLADFATLLGDRWLAGRAEELQFALMRAADDPSVSRVGREIAVFVRRVERTPFLRTRLAGIGHDASHAAEKIGGPFARGNGLSVDARHDDPTYRDLGFVPVLHDGNDAWARLRVRLGELTQSMDLIRAVGTTTFPAPPALTVGSGRGKATVETPRGPATLHIMLQDRQVTEAHLDTPTARLVHLVPGMATGRELADALIGIASLDLSPWEIDR